MAGLKDLIFTLRTDAEKNLVDFALNAETNDVLVYATSTFVKPFNLSTLWRWQENVPHLAMLGCH